MVIGLSAAFSIFGLILLALAISRLSSKRKKERLLDSQQILVPPMEMGGEMVKIDMMGEDMEEVGSTSSQRQHIFQHILHEVSQINMSMLCS